MTVADAADPFMIIPGESSRKIIDANKIISRSLIFIKCDLHGTSFFRHNSHKKYTHSTDEYQTGKNAAVSRETFPEEEERNTGYFYFEERNGFCIIPHGKKCSEKGFT
ncbi:MAG: hypothetical protein U5N26_01385 [Candidatus Marinimicrobia bacterium]|nr:hypothetical protein [Candidatus Neomarinimicrobiota bacterium]